jgi:hypothetical protein
LLSKMGKMTGFITLGGAGRLSAAGFAMPLT